MTDNLPPGTTGLPLLGETLAFLQNGFDFVESRTRRHGPIFRTRILGRDTAMIVGPDACALWIDPELIQRDGSQPGFFFELLAGPSLPHLDGETHRARKTLLLQGFTRDALAGYLPELLRVTESAIARWSGTGTFDIFEWIPELKRLAIEGICANVLGITAPEETDAIVREYNAVIKGTAGLPVNLPGTDFHRALRARDRLLERFAESIRRHQQNPGSDGISRILAAALPDGTKIDPAALKRELHHILVAGYIIFAEFAWAVQELSRRPELREQLRGEVQSLAPGPISLEMLDRMPLLTRVVMEVKRLCPILPVIFGVAKKSFEFNGRTVPAGWAVMWGLRSTHLDPAIYTDPDVFDPERFSAARGEHRKHPHAFVPQGPGPETGHKCPGTDYATYFMKAFIVALLRSGMSWELTAPDASYNWKQIPPEPKGGLRVRFSGGG